MTINFRKGMPYGEFLAMMEEHTAEQARQTIAETCGIVTAEVGCGHPFKSLERDIKVAPRYRRDFISIVVIVEFTCGICGAELPKDTAGIRL